MTRQAEIEAINLVIDRIDEALYRVPDEDSLTPDEEHESIVASLYRIINERHEDLARAYLTLPDGAGRLADFMGQLGIRWFALAESRCPSRTPKRKAAKLRRESISGLVHWLNPNYHYLRAVNTHLIGMELARPGGLPNGWYYNLRLIVWGEESYTRIQDKLLCFFSELIDAYDRGQAWVSQKTLEERRIFEEGTGIDEVFQVLRKYGSRHCYDPSRKLVDESRAGFFRMIDPANKDVEPSEPTRSMSKRPVNQSPFVHVVDTIR